MCTRQWRKPLDQGEQRRAGSQSVGKQRNRRVAGSEPLSQNSGADHSDQQEARAERVRRQATWDRHRLGQAT
jgi:hypothetical protein